jgi:ubiquinone/menaquinone biosynthesis C-methylase UbiE
MKAENLKLMVQEKYGAIAKQSVLENSNSCCGSSGCCGEVEFSMIGDEYTQVEGYNPEADLGLGCGLPTQYAGIKPGNHVLDLGSGAGNDCFIARTIVGETGKVTGIDFTDSMVEKANKNLEKTAFKNISFVKGDIENMPLPDNSYDVVVSNCVLNLVPDKVKAFAEIMRVLKYGGHFCVSDVVLKGSLPEKLRSDAEMYAGCVSGAIAMDDYLAIIEQSGFKSIEIHKQRKIEIPEKTMAKHLNENEIKDFLSGDSGIYSITISAIKPIE